MPASLKPTKLLPSDRLISGHRKEVRRAAYRAKSEVSLVRGLSVGEADRLTLRIFAAYCRMARRKAIGDGIDFWIEGPFSAVSTVAVAGFLASYASRPDIKSVPSIQTQLFLYMIVGAMLSGLMAISPAQIRRLRSWRRSPPYPHKPVPLLTRFGEMIIALLPSLTFGGILGGTAIAANWRLVSSRPGLFFNGFATGVFYIALFMLYRVVARFGINLALRSAELQPLDEVVVYLLPLVVIASGLSSAWCRPDVSRYLINRVEEIARVCEQVSWARRKSPFLSSRNRSKARENFLRLAAVFREHGLAISVMNDRKEYDVITKSLLIGLRAVLENDWLALLANAPEDVRTRRTITGWGFRNALPAALLAVGAIALPYVPPFRNAGASVQALRVSLFVYAAVMLIPGQRSLADLFTSAFSRTSSTK